MKTKAKSSKVLWLIVALAAIVCVVVAVALSVGSTGKSAADQLKVADRYLDELKYDKAIAAYEAVIAIDPKNTDAYLGLAQAYEAKGEPILAAQTLAFAYAKVSEGDLAILESTYNGLVNTYPEVQESVNQGTIVLGKAVEDSTFDSFFHAEEHRANGGNAGNSGNGNGNGSGNSGNAGNSSTVVNGENSALLTQFTLMGRPLGDWKFDELLSYIRSNFEAQPEYGDDMQVISTDRMYGHYDESTGSYIHVVMDYENESSSKVISIRLNVNGVDYVTGDRSAYGDFRYWDVQAYYDGGVPDVAHTICNKSVEEYLESVCPGAYKELQSKNETTVNDVHLKKEKGYATFYANEELYTLYVPGGYLQLSVGDGMIYHLGIQFYDTWVVTTDVSQATSSGGGFGYGQDYNQGYDQGYNQGSDMENWIEVNVNVDWDRYTLFNRPLTDWTGDSLLDYIKNNYPLSYDEDGLAGYLIGTDVLSFSDVRGEIIIESREEGFTSMTVSIYDGPYIWITFSSDMITYEFANYLGGNMPSRDALLGDIPGLFNLTTEEYVNNISGGVYDELKSQVQAAFNGDAIWVNEDGSAIIASDNANMSLYTDFENGLISNVQITVFH